MLPHGPDNADIARVSARITRYSLLPVVIRCGHLAGLCHFAGNRFGAQRPGYERC
jgi:hypothetical protein